MGSDVGVRVGSGVEVGAAAGEGAGVSIEGGADTRSGVEMSSLVDCSVPHPDAARSNTARNRQDFISGLRKAPRLDMMEVANPYQPHLAEVCRRVPLTGWPQFTRTPLPASLTSLKWCV